MNRRRWLVAGLLLLLTAGGLFQLSRQRCFSLVLPSICRVDTGERIVALSFDDGPTAAGLAATLPLLKAADAKATFFIVGAEARRQPELLRTMLAAGMEIGNHSWSHVRMAGVSPGFAAREVERTAALIRSAGGDDHRLFRAPYGKKLIALPWVLRQRGYRLVMADVIEPTDAANPREFADRMLAKVRPGSILLLHPMYPANQQARAALPMIVSGLKARGYRMVTISELLASGEPTS